MEKIRLTKIAKTGVKNAKKVKRNETPYYKKIVKEADERIQEEHRRQAYVYIRSKNYVAR